MDPITIALGLAQFAPQLIKWLSGSDKAEAVAQKAIDVATAVTGTQSGSAATFALKSSPELVLKYQQAVLDQEIEFQKLAVSNAGDINKTMQAEAAAEHWPTYGWRPAIGFAVAIDLVLSVLVVAIAYAGVIFFQVDAQMLSYLPGFLGAMAMLIGVAAPILGIASFFRGKMQSDPSIQTVNKG